MGYGLKLNMIGEVHVGERVKVLPANHKKTDGDIIGMVVRNRISLNAGRLHTQVEVRMQKPSVGEVRSYGGGTLVGVIQNTSVTQEYQRNGDMLI